MDKPLQHNPRSTQPSGTQFDQVEVDPADQAEDQAEVDQEDQADRQPDQHYQDNTHGSNEETGTLSDKNSDSHFTAELPPQDQT